MGEFGPGPEVDSLTANADLKPETTLPSVRDKEWSFFNSTHPPKAIPDRFASINANPEKVIDKNAPFAEPRADRAKADMALREGEPNARMQDIDQAHLVAKRVAGILGRQRSNIDNRYIPRIDLANAGIGGTDEARRLENAMATELDNLSSQKNLESAHNIQGGSVTALLSIVSGESMMFKNPGFNFDAERRIVEADFALLTSKLGDRSKQSEETDALGDKYDIVDYTRPDGYIVRFYQLKDGKSNLGITIVAPENA